WGETVAGGSMINVAFGLLFVPVVIIGAIGFDTFGSSPAFGFTVLTVAIVLGLLLVAVQFAVETVFRTALFDYAASETIRSPFTRDDLDAGLRRKRGLFRRFRRLRSGGGV